MKHIPRLLWQRRRNHHNQRITRFDCTERVIQDQDPSKIRGLGEESNISALAVSSH